MRDLSNELTVFVIACEKGENYLECLESINNQTVVFQFKEILDVQPMNEAFNQMIYQCETPYFIQVDEDFILNKDAVESMYDSMVKAPELMSSIHFKLQDFFLDETIGSIVIYKHKAIKNFLWKNVIACDILQRQEVKNAGYKFKIDQRVIGVHHKHWDLQTIFRKFCNQAEKEHQQNIPKHVFKPLLNKLKKNFSDLNLFAVFGYITGLVLGKNRQTERDYSTYVNQEFTRIARAYDSIQNFNKIEFICPTNNKILQKLSEHLDIEFEENIDKILKSSKNLILWNSISHIRNTHDIWKKELVEYKKDNNEPIYVVERGALPDTLFIDKTGFLYDSEMYDERHWNKTLTVEENKLIENYIASFVADNNSLEPQQIDRIARKQFEEQTNSADYNSVVFIPLQVHDDTVMILWSDWVKSFKHLHKIITDLAKTFPKVKFIVKNHPIEIARKKQNYIFQSNLKNTYVADEIHYKDCIEHSDVILTINSGVGLQAMMWKKPTLILGNTFYQFENLNQKINSYKELVNVLESDKIVFPDGDKIKRFLFYLKYNYYTDCKLVKTGINSTAIEKIHRIVYRHPYNDSVIVLNTHNQKTNLIDLQTCSIDHWLLGETCYQVVIEKNITPPKIIIGVRTKEDMEKLKILYPDITVYLDENRQTKYYEINNLKFKVPVPVLGYLRKYKQ